MKIGCFLMIMEKKDILKSLLDSLDERLVEARNNEPYSDHVRGKFNFGQHEVLFFFDEKECFVEVNRKVGVDYVYLDNVADYLSEHCFDWEDIDVDKEVSDFWGDHGFSDEADYIRYRYG